MTIEFSLDTRGGIRPEAEPFLSRYRPERFHHLRLRRRPPVGAYAVSIAQVWPPLVRVLDLLEVALAARPFQDPANVSWETPLLESTERLLYAIQEHLEDCDYIIKSCFPSDAEFAKHPIAKKYRSAVRRYRDLSGLVVNTLKHHQGRLRVLAFSGPTFATIGYFVERAQLDGSIGPDPDIHRGGDTAFSYAFNLRLHLVSLLFLSSTVASAVEAIVGKPDEDDPPLASSDLEFRKLATRIANLSRIVFPDEYQIDFFGVEVTNALGQSVIRVSYPAETHRAKPPEDEEWRMFMSYRGDGVSTTFTVPYKMISRADG